MTVARITEISSVSGKSFQDAILQGVERANKTLKNVKGAWVKDQEVTIDGGKSHGIQGDPEGDVHPDGVSELAGTVAAGGRGLMRTRRRE